MSNRSGGFHLDVSPLTKCLLLTKSNIDFTRQNKTWVRPAYQHQLKNPEEKAQHVSWQCQKAAWQNIDMWWSLRLEPFYKPFHSFSFFPSYLSPTLLCHAFSTSPLSSELLLSLPRWHYCSRREWGWEHNSVRRIDWLIRTQVLQAQTGIASHAD